MRKEIWLSPLWLGLIAFLLYLPTTQFGLVNYDDPWLIRDNYTLHHPDTKSLNTVLFDLSKEQRLRLGSEYLPLRDLSVMADFAIHGDSYGKHHLSNAIYYGLMCAFLGLFLFSWSNKFLFSWLTGLLFVFHPVHVESVAWLSERKGLLAGLFLFASLYLFSEFAKKGKAWRWLLSTLFFCFAIWSKALVIVGLVLFSFILFFSEKDSNQEKEEDSKQKKVAPYTNWMPFIALSILSILAFLPFWLTGRKVAMVSEFHGGSWLQTFWMMCEVHTTYLGLLFYWGGYAIMYPVKVGALSPAKVLFGFVAVVLLCGFFFYSIVKRHKVASFALASWLFFLLPVSQLIFPLQNYIADRYLLLPSLGWCILLAAWFVRPTFFRPKMVLFGLFSIISILLSLQQMNAWKSSKALYTQVLEVSPQNVHALAHLSRIERQRGDLRKAWHWSQLGVRYHPKHPKIRLQRSLFFLKVGKLEKAISELKIAVQDPKADKARANLALLLIRSNQMNRAMHWAKQAVSIQPLKSHNQRVLGVVALRKGMLDIAGKAFRAAYQIEPINPSNVFNMGLLHFQRKQYPAAKSYFQRYLLMRPRHKAKVLPFLNKIK